MMKNRNLNYNIKTFYKDYSDTGLYDIIKQTYNIILNKYREETIDLREIKDEEIEKINELITSSILLCSLSLGNNISIEETKYFLLKSSAETYKYNLLIGYKKWEWEKINKNPNLQETYKKYLDEELKETGTNPSECYIPKKMKSYMRRYAKNDLGGEYEKILAAGAFFVMNKIIKNLKNQETLEYGKNIIDAYWLIENAEQNSKARRNKKYQAEEQIYDTEKDLQLFQEDFKNGSYIKLNHNDSICKIMKDYRVNEKKAKSFYKRRSS